jgi:hypothetical protein
MGSQVDVSAADLGGDFLGVAGRRNELWFRYRFRGMLCGHDESRRSQSRASGESLINRSAQSTDTSRFLYIMIVAKREIDGIETVPRQFYFLGLGWLSHWTC